MNESSKPRSYLFIIPVLAGIIVPAVACSSSTSSTNTTLHVTPGGQCSVAGAQVQNGCNTCTCTDGAWACTEMACVDGGEPGGSGPGGSVGAGGKGPGGTIGIAGSAGGSAGAVGGGPATCVSGTTSSDGCNSCTCVNGNWACTDRACPPVACTDGSTMFDGCNTCTCTSGQWACTKRYCPPSADAGSALRPCGARAGDTCTAGEYCAYQAGQLCGAADAQAVCLPRPVACTTQYNPVCGCDGNTYSNACEAAGAGTGVRTTGACTPLPF